MKNEKLNKIDFEDKIGEMKKEREQIENLKLNKNEFEEKIKGFVKEQEQIKKEQE